MNKTKKLLAGLFLAMTFSLVVGSFVGEQVAHADFLDELFSSNDEISFTQYEGQLGQLSGEGFDAALTSSTDLREFVLRIVNFALGFLGIFAVIIIIYGGVLYVSSGGEEDRTQQGKKAITYAIIGLLIVLVSFALVNTVIRGALVGDNGAVNQGSGTNIGGSFSAASSEVETVAINVYNGYLLLSETTEELKNIQNDASKSSLSYSSTFVSKSDIINFLLSARSKLKNIQSKVPKFSDTYNTSNNLIREIDLKIDTIQNINNNQVTFYKMTGQTLEQCAFDEAAYATAKAVSAVVFVNPEDYTEKGCKQYPADLFDTWGPIQADMISATGSFTGIVEPVAKDYLQILQQEVGLLHELMNGPLAGIAAVETGDAGNSFRAMVDSYGYSTDQYNQYLLGNSVTYNKGFFNTVQNWDLQVDTNQAGNILYQALENQVAFAESVAKLQTVVAKLKANVISGNAPLIVRFDVLDSVDPAGGSIVDENIDWKNIDGSYTFEGEQIGLNSAAVPAATCHKENQNSEDISGEGPAFRVCTFQHPGTYQATVTINSNDPSKYVAGKSTIIIKVQPPNTQIELTMKAGSQEPVEIISYYDTGILRANKDYVAVILDEAKDGIDFDASTTQNAVNFRWDFGDGNIQDGGIELQKVSHKFSQEGRYQVTLEVINNLGEVDRKIFTLDVGAVAARIRVLPDNNALIGQTVTIDGSQSAVSSGSIKSYTWTIKKRGEETPINLGGNTNKSSFTHKFEQPGLYEIDLSVISNVNSVPVNAQTYQLEIISQAPIAQFEYDVQDKNQPSTYTLYGGKSYDPDGDNENIVYEWEVKEVNKPVGISTPKWIFVGSNESSKQPQIRFTEKGDYEVILTVSDKTTLALTSPESTSISKTIKVTDVLDAAWGSDQLVTSVLGEEGNKPGEAVIDFQIISANGKAFDINFGDDQSDSGNIVNGQAQVSHSYKEAGKFHATVNIYDEDDNNKTLQRNIFIGGANTPIAKITLFVNGAEISDFSRPIIVSRKDILTLDASESKNVDGTGRKLKYAWDFGDTDKSSNRSATHSYDELSPKESGFYQVKLQVTDQDDPSLQAFDDIQIDVRTEAPKFSGLQAIVNPTKGSPITPVSVNMRVHDPEDPDGEIIQYRWWYFDLDDPDEPLGIQITQAPTAQLVIGTNGKDGQKIKYGFAVEVMDSDNIRVSSLDILEAAQMPTLQVQNGPNSQPEASFKVDKTKIDVGSSVTFTSSSKDLDGQIVAYIWDFEGDGFFNNVPTNKSTVEHVYNEKNLDGYKVRLKVIDDKGGEDTSDPISIIIDSQAKPPVAAFTFEVVPGSEGQKIQFINNSTVDQEAGAKIKEYIWDFDTTSTLAGSDSDGDGNKDNDKDSSAQNPQRLYQEFGTYSVKLTVIDTHGNSDEAINTLELPLANNPTAAFTYKVLSSDFDSSSISSKTTVQFINNSYADNGGGANLQQYSWDFDTSLDSDGDGKTDNDSESKTKEPLYVYNQPGTYTVKLTISDNQGNIDDVSNQVRAIYSALDDLGETPSPDLIAYMSTSPAASADGIIYLDGESGSVTFNFTKSEGSISNYSFDKNTEFDTNGNGVKDDDIDFKTVLSGTWKTNFEKSFGKIVVRLTVEDIYGNVDSVLQEIRFR